jgi:hypothetical protein
MVLPLGIAVALTHAGTEVLDEFETDTPVELFHYTDTAGLIGILQNKGELWVTDVRCLNDTDELALGYRLVEQAIQARSTHPAHGLLTRLLAHPAYVSGLVFTTSFSAEPDLLSQWRAYTGDGAGFAIGFVSATLSGLELDGRQVPLNVLRVDYDPRAQAARAARLVDKCLEVLQSVEGQQQDHQLDQFLVMALGLLLPAFAATCKNPGFTEEREYRVVVRSHQDPLLSAGAEPQLTMPICSFRAGRHGITPFIKLRFPADTLTAAISRIVVGPRNAAPDTEAKLRVLLANAGVRPWSAIPVEWSATTYR